jgi:hypothetical protein
MAVAAAATAHHAHASHALAPAVSGDGYVRLAHLSPNTPAVDVYLYSFGNPTARLVLRHVSYGTVSPYELLPTGDYTVSMRPAGAAPTTKPVLSTEVAVSAGDSYTVAGMGPASGLRLQILHDTLAVPGGHSLVRVIQASLREHTVRVVVGGHMVAKRLAFGRATTYRTVAAGASMAQATGGTESASLHLSLPADSTHTLVVLDSSGGLRLVALPDAAGSQVQPSGGAATGFGGMAPRPASSPLPWLALTGAGMLLAAVGAWRYRRARLTRTRAL